MNLDVGTMSKSHALSPKRIAAGHLIEPVLKSQSFNDISSGRLASSTQVFFAAHFQTLR
jgi:hypothetical protein